MTVTHGTNDSASARFDDGILVVARVDLDHEGRMVYAYEVWGHKDDPSHPLSILDSGSDLSAGVDKPGQAGPADMLTTLAGFLYAAAESYRHEMQHGPPSENKDLFSPAAVEWAYQNSDELAMFCAEHEED